MHSQIEGQVQVLQWKENITLKSIEAFRQEMENLVQSHESKFILDLMHVSYINSAGLGIIAESVLQAKKVGKELVISNPQQSIQEIFAIVKFDSFMKVFANEKKAIQYLLADSYEQAE